MFLESDFIQDLIFGFLFYLFKDQENFQVQKYKKINFVLCSVGTLVAVNIFTVLGRTFICESYYKLFHDVANCFTFI